jgi:hypothetical protein
MIKRVLVCCAVLLAGVFLACSGSSGTGDLLQKPQIVTDRDSIVDTLCPYSQTFQAAQGRGQVLAIVNNGQEDLTVTALTLSSTDPSLVTEVPLAGGGVYAPFLLVVKGVIDPNSNPDAGILINNTIKSTKTGFVSLFFNSPDAGIWNASLTIASNAENAPNKVIPLQIISPDAGTQGCPR